MSDNIILRESTLTDCDIFSQWEKNPAVTEFFTINNNKTYEETVREFIEREEDPCARQFTICLKDSGQPIGRIYVSNINDHYDSLDISRIYIADPQIRGKGYGEAALRLCLAWAFDEMKCERVTLDHFTDNKVARKLYDKVGFVFEGIMRHGGKKNGEYVDLHLMSILKDEYYL